MPIMTGDRLIPGAVGRVVQLLRADMDGDLEGRLRGAYTGVVLFCFVFGAVDGW